jgi:hypothetical protein
MPKVIVFFTFTPNQHEIHVLQCIDTVKIKNEVSSS